MSQPFIDPYIDQTTGELRNLLGAQHQCDFYELEAQAVFANELEIADSSVPRTNDLNELCLLHARLFNGVYAWAGNLRTVDIRKGEENSPYFLPRDHMLGAAKYVFDQLRGEKYLQGLSKAEFVDRLAYFYDQLNYIHPFREGNGRTQRLFWQRVANDAGYVIDWNGIRGDQNDHASKVAAETENRKPLIEMFTRIVRRLD